MDTFSLLTHLAAAGGGILIGQALGRRPPVGYARVSTIEQDAALQHDALTSAGAVRIAQREVAHGVARGSRNRVYPR